MRKLALYIWETGGEELGSNGVGTLWEGGGGEWDSQGSGNQKKLGKFSQYCVLIFWNRNSTEEETGSKR